MKEPMLEKAILHLPDNYVDALEAEIVKICKHFNISQQQFVRKRTPPATYAQTLFVQRTLAISKVIDGKIIAQIMGVNASTITRWRWRYLCDEEYTNAIKDL